MIFKILLIAHIIADFYLQNDEKSKKKETQHITKSNWYKTELVKHVLYYVLMSSTIFLLFEVNTWVNYVIVVAALMSHGIIDHIKIYCTREWFSHKKLLFFVDQACHVLSLMIISFLLAHHFTPNALFYFLLTLENEMIIHWILAILLLGNTGNVVFQILFSQFSPESTHQTQAHTAESNNSQCSESANNQEDQGFDNAGALIGILERLLIFTMLAFNELSSIGFVIGAKSLVRFKKLNQTKFGEYFLIGTLFSVLYTFIVFILIFQSRFLRF